MSNVARLTRQEAEDFLFEEARLLDERLFEAWLHLFTEDGRYWIPIVEDADPTTQMSILYDDSPLLQMRVHHLLHERHLPGSPGTRSADAHGPQLLPPAGRADDAREDSRGRPDPNLYKRKRELDHRFSPIPSHTPSSRHDVSRVIAGLDHGVGHPSGFWARPKHLSTGGKGRARTPMSC